MLWGRPKKKKKKDCIFCVSRMQVKSRSTEQALAAVCTVVALGTRPDCVLLPEALGPVALVFTLFFFFLFFGCTHGVWKFRGRESNVRCSCSNTGSLTCAVGQLGLHP